MSNNWPIKLTKACTKAIRTKRLKGSHLFEYFVIRKALRWALRHDFEKWRNEQEESKRKEFFLKKNKENNTKIQTRIITKLCLEKYLRIKSCKTSNKIISIYLFELVIFSLSNLFLGDFSHKTP